MPPCKTLKNKRAADPRVHNQIITITLSGTRSVELPLMLDHIIFTDMLGQVFSDPEQLIGDERDSLLQNQGQ